ncbi:MAG: energy transducer TonB [Gammaproteobacteria bacterium]
MEQEKESSTLVLYVILALLAVVGGAWLFLTLKPAAPTPQVATTAPAPLPLEVPDEIDPRFDLEQNLDMGQMALSAGQLVEPTDGSALYFFLSALEQDAENRTALDGLESISTTVAASAAEQLAGEDFLGLDGSLRVLERIDAADVNLLALKEQLALLVESKFAEVDGATRRAQWVPAQALIDQLATIPNLDPDELTLRIDELAAAQERAVALAASVAAQTAADAAAQAAEDEAAAASDTAATDDEAVEEEDAGEAVLELLASLRGSMTDGRLIAPADDSARYYLSELRGIAPDDPALSSGYSDLIGALTQRAVTQAGSGNFDEADGLLTAAADLGVPDTRIRLAQSSVLDAQLEAESQRVIPVSELINTKVVRPRYPSRALRNDAEGYVLVNFTVLADGTTADVVAVESSERYADQFRRAAQAAVGQWEFVPREFRGQIIEQRVRARVAFEINQ